MLRLLPSFVVLVLLGGIYLDTASRQKMPEGIIVYHGQVRDAVVSIPYRVGNWVGTDREIRQEALRILDANVSLSRTYHNLETGRTATLLLVHGQDTRSLLGHYPPVCYPSQGWTQTGAIPRKVSSNGTSVDATEYTFAYESVDESAQLAVLHFTVLPDGRSAPDMQLLEAAARDRRGKFFGGASVQFIVDARSSAAERAEAYETLLGAVSQWVAVVQSGGKA